MGCSPYLSVNPYNFSYLRPFHLIMFIIPEIKDQTYIILNWSVVGNELGMTSVMVSYLES